MRVNREETVVDRAEIEQSVLTFDLGRSLGVDKGTGRVQVGWVSMLLCVDAVAVRVDVLDGEDG